tara:strand:- start:6603 stop:7844 length:1242 start_codon:yes stop_codon:yes gene_type:complete
MKKLSCLFTLIILFIGCEKEEVIKYEFQEGLVRTIEVPGPATTVTVVDTVNINFPPPEYSFTRNGKSTVFYTGQTTRLGQADALKSAMNDVTSTEAGILNMFDNGQGFSDTSLNSTKKVGNKTGAKSANTAVNKAKFDGWIKEFVDNVIPAVNTSTDGSGGVAGLVSDASGARTNLKANAKGLEMNQIFSKGLIGAFNLDQIIGEGGYLSNSKLDPVQADNDAEVYGYAGTDDNVAEELNVTKMEHFWDEGFGYLYGQDNQYNPETGKGSLLNYYLKKVEGDIPGISKKIYDAFVLGRAAIVSKNYTLRDEQAKIIKVELSKVVGNKAAYYLSSAADKVTSGTTNASYLHALSEGYGLIFSLQFTQDASGNPYMNYDEVNAMLAELEAGNGFWDRTEAELDTMAATVKAATGL